jgi:tRNA-intron endonuclease
VKGRVRPDATALVADPADASTVYARGYFGTLDGSSLTLDRPETTYLAEMSRIDLVDDHDRPVEWPTVYRRALQAEPGFPIRYLVYRDLRQRGYVVRAGPWSGAFAVLPRGGILNKTPSRYWVVPVSERTDLSVAQLREIRSRAQGARKNLLLAVVDEESDLTYYRVREVAPKGTVPPVPATKVFPAFVADDRVFVHDPEGVEALGRGAAYGSRVGSRLELSLLESVSLVDAGRISLRDAKSHRPVPVAQLTARAKRLDPDFSERLAAYRALRARGLIVKTGFKYGAHFRAYLRDPEQSHAKYLVRAVPVRFATPWPLVAGAVRLAQGVRKEHLFAVVDGPESVAFLSLERIRP